MWTSDWDDKTLVEIRSTLLNDALDTCRRIDNTTSTCELDYDILVPLRAEAFRFEPDALLDINSMIGTVTELGQPCRTLVVSNLSERRHQSCNIYVYANPSRTGPTTELAQPLTPDNHLYLQLATFLNALHPVQLGVTLLSPQE